MILSHIANLMILSYLLISHMIFINYLLEVYSTNIDYAFHKCRYVILYTVFISL